MPLNFPCINLSLLAEGVNFFMYIITQLDVIKLTYNSKSTRMMVL